MAGTNKQREEITRKLVSMQMEKIGLTYEDAMNTPEFWRIYTLTTQQTEEWRVEALKLIQKTFKCSKKRGMAIMQWFELDLGLRIDDNPPTTCKTTSSPYYTTTCHTTTIAPEPKKVKKQTLWQKIKRLWGG